MTNRASLLDCQAACSEDLPLFKCAGERAEFVYEEASSDDASLSAVVYRCGLCHKRYASVRSGARQNNDICVRCPVCFTGFCPSCAQPRTPMHEVAGAQAEPWLVNPEFACPVCTCETSTNRQVFEFLIARCGYKSVAEARAYLCMYRRKLRSESIRKLQAADQRCVQSSLKPPDWKPPAQQAEVAEQEEDDASL